MGTPPSLQPHNAAYLRHRRGDQFRPMGPLDGRVTRKTMTPTRWWVGSAAAAIVLVSLLLANWVTTDYGFIPIGFGLETTAGTVFAGFMLAGRDAVQDSFGRWAVIGLIVIGTILSFAIASPAIALASAAAFGVAELLNFAVYTPLRNKSRLGDKRWALAVVASNITGAVGDTVIFLGIAFGAAAILPALPGQLVGKMYATILYLLVGYLLARFVFKKLTAKAAASEARASSLQG